jgi:hypothetical protein
MELYGSLSNISGSVTASAFTGSFIGDGSGLSGIQAAGVTGLNLSQISIGSISASLSPNGFNVNTGTSITGSLNVSGEIISQTTPLVSGSSQIEITGTTGYSTFSSSIATTDSNQELRLNSIETSTGSLNSFTSSIDTTIKNKLNTDGVISGSSQILNGSGIVSSSTQVTAYGFATTGSNLFIGTQTHSGSILPSVDNAYDLGSPTYQWRDVYISSGSLYIDGTKVLSSTAQELTITTDTGQSIKILEGTTDSIILQTADGDIELKSSADGDILLDPTYGKIMLKGTIEVFNGNKIQSSVGGTPVVFANDIGVSGSIELTGTIDGIDLTAFSSSLNGRLGSLESSGGSLNDFTSSAIGRLNALETTTSSLNTYTSSNNTRLGVIETTTSSLNTFTSSADGRLSSIETTTGSILSVNTTQNGRLDSLETTSGSILSANTTQNGRLDSIEGKTGSYATTGSNSFNGNQIVTGSLTITENLTVLGSSSLLIVTSSQLALSSSTISVNVFEPAERFGGLKVYDSGSQSHQATASLLWDSQNNHWIYQNASGSNYSGGMLLSGPRNTGSLGDELSLTNGKLPRSVGGDHLDNSIITQVGGDAIGISGSLTITGSILSSTTPLVSGSSQINHNTTTNYDANQHIDHTTVSISAGNGLSGGGTIAATRTISLDTASSTFTTGVKSKMNDDGVVSGSSQISFNGITDKPTLVSGSSQITYGSLSGIPSGIVSGSSQITFGSISGIPSGLVSGSSQIDLTATTNYSSGIKTRLNAEGVLSGSAQVVAVLPAGTVSGSAQITFSGISSKPTTLSGYGITDALPLAGGTMTGIITTVSSGTAINFSGQTDSFGYNTTSGQGTYIKGTGSTYIYGGGTFYDGSTVRTLLHSGNFTSYAMSGAGYSANQNLGTSNSVKFGAHCDLNISNSAFRFYDGSTFRGGLGTDDWAHSGSAANITLFASGVLHFTSGGSKRAYFDTSGHLLPQTNNTYNLGSASLGWANVYTNDLHLSNMNKPEGNDIDGTSGSWTIQEGAENLYIINNNNGKKFKISLEEI